jgi:hypothetical protein
MKQTSLILLLTVLIAVVGLSWAQSNIKTDSMTSAAAKPLKAANKDDSSSEESEGKD